ncbi:MAG: DUF1934 domain-containing protein [Clostridiales Family XIII bacterium]|nr:DUF1934 domain-containing protein [Clostridiales Family XIII bacterium]
MKDIMLKIIGNPVSPSGEPPQDEEIVELVTEGRFYQRGDSVYLDYEESDFSGMKGCTTSLKITGNKIRMQRYDGDIGIETAIEFEKGKRFTGLYDTPFGSVEMEVLTNDIRNDITQVGEGSLDIDYCISLKGLSEGRSKLSVEII